MASSGGAGAALVGMERKVQQLTKVIYHLNSRGDDAGDLGGASSSYENEIEGILRDAGERVKRFHAACSHTTDAQLIADKVHEVEAKYEIQKQRALRDMEDFKRRVKESQATIRSEAEAKVAGMAKELEACKKEFAQRVKQFAEMAEGLEKKAGESSKGENKRASAEMAELVKKQNSKNN